MQHMSRREKALIYFCFMVTIACAMYVIDANAQDDMIGELKRHNFSTPKWESGSEYIYHNITSEEIVLTKYNGTGEALEDFTTYTEYEESLDWITVVNSTFVTAKTDLRWTRYLVYDYGVDYFNGYFDITFAFYTAGTGSGGINDHFFIMMCNETVSDRSAIRDAGDDYWGINIVNDNSGDDYNWRVNYQDNGILSQPSFTEDNGIHHIWLYFRVLREDTSLKILAYNNPDFTDLRFSRNITISSDTTYRYFYAVNSIDIAGYSGYYYEGWVKDVSFNLPQERYKESGNWYSTNLLENATVGSIAESFYGSGNIPHPSTSIETFLSDDNATWTLFEEDDSIVEIVKSESYTSLYVRFRLNSSGDGEFTPSVDYFHMFYEDESLGEGGLNGVWKEYNVTGVVFKSGTPIFGNLTSLAFKDGKVSRVEEIASQTPAVDTRVNFTGIPSDIKSLSVRMYDIYDGSPNDEVHYDAFNFSSNEWVTLAQKGEGSFEWTNVSLSMAYVNGVNPFIEDGKVWVRMHEEGSGIGGHYIEGDHVRLRGFTNTTELSVNVTEIVQEINAIDGEWVTYPMHTVSIVVGTNVWGDLSNLTYRDGLTMFGHEESESPAMLVYGNFTIPKGLVSGSLHIYGEYIGNPAHDIRYEVWNFDLIEWQLLGEPLVSGDGWVWQNQSISLDGQYRQEYNDTHDDVWIRLIHINAGVITHSLEVDYVALHGFIPVVKPIWWLGAVFIAVPLLLILSYALRRK